LSCDKISEQRFDNFEEGEKTDKGRKMTQFDIQTHAKDELIDITSAINTIVTNSQVKNGVCSIYVPHTTAGVTINENADPSVKSDILLALRSLVPDSLPYSHMEGNSPGHVKSTLVGCSASVLINKGHLALGTWQGIFFCEFDGPRNRKVYVKIVPG
jgi:secondary thiamine-phosphate synthase enzyme